MPIRVFVPFLSTFFLSLSCSLSSFSSLCVRSAAVCAPALAHRHSVCRMPLLEMETGMRCCGRFCIEFKSTTFAAIKGKRKAFYLVFIALYIRASGYRLLGFAIALFIMLFGSGHIVCHSRAVRETNNLDMVMLFRGRGFTIMDLLSVFSVLWK